VSTIEHKAELVADACMRSDGATVWHIAVIRCAGYFWLFQS